MATIINDSYQQRELSLVMSENFKIQSAFDVPIPVGDLDFRQPQTAPAFHTTQTARTDRFYCDGVTLAKRVISSKLAVFTITFAASAYRAAGFLAKAMGAAAAPTGTPADETQTITNNGDGGGFKVAFDFEGLAGTTAALDFDASVAEVQAALDSLRSIKPGNVVVSGTSLALGLTVTFSGKLAKANVPLLTIVDDTTTNGTAAVAAGTAGENKAHLITRQTGNTPVKFSVIEGFENGKAMRYQNLVVNTYQLRITRRTDAVVTVTCFGSPDGEEMVGFVYPVCVLEDTISAFDSRLLISDDYVTNDLNEFTYDFSNNIPIDEYTFRFDDITPNELKAGIPTSNFTLQFIGEPESAVYEAAENSDTAFEPIEFHGGRPGERIVIIAPNAQLFLDDSPIVFVGGQAMSAFNLTALPTPNGSGVIDRAEYRGAETVQFLQV